MNQAVRLTALVASSAMTGCTNVNATAPPRRAPAVHFFWLPLVTNTSVIYTEGLLARVDAALPTPTVNFSDSNVEHGWLWVNIEYHLGVNDVSEVYKSKKKSNPTGSVHAWVRGVPESIELEIEDSAGSPIIGKCDLGDATKPEGYKFKFEHASAIAADGVFNRSVPVNYRARANSEKYDGVGPIAKSSEFTVRVAEAMAVGKR